MIVRLVKITLIGLLREKGKILTELQKMGCLHLISLQTPSGEFRRRGPSSDAQEALKFLWACPQKLRQMRETSAFDPVAVETRALELKARMQELEDERDYLITRLADLQPWGEFTFPAPEEIGELRLWFYVVPHYILAKAVIPQTYAITHLDNRFAYLIVLSPQEPESMPVPRTHTGNRSPKELKTRLEAVEYELEDLQLERTSLTRWCTLFARSLDRLEDVASIYEAAEQTLSAAPLFAVQGWAPRENSLQIQQYAHEAGLVCEVREPQPGEVPPTLLRNHPVLASGQDLVSFYTTPGYWGWDPSAVVLFSFALFFAMIVADAGYGLLLGIGLLLAWRRLGRSDTGRRFRPCLAMMIGGTVLYGVLVNSYFGLPARPGSFLASLELLDLNDFSTMMGLSVAIGVTHLIMANIADAWRCRHSPAALAPVGWILIFLGGVCWAVSAHFTPFKEALPVAGMVLAVTGGLGVVWFSEVRGSRWQRLLGGLKGLARLANAFGDTLSYLRLFALGLASASLAINFNMLAKNVYEALPGLGLLFAILIIIIGHGLNLVLAIASGFIHGLRLNFIEFFNWSLYEEGYRFQVFAKKEKS